MKLTFLEYKAIVESSPNMIWRSGTNAECNYFNETWLKFTGKKLEEEIGNGWAKGVHPDDFDLCLKTYLNAFSKHNAFEMEYRLLRYDGEWRWINDRGVPFFDDSKNFAGYIGSCMDVTEKIEGKKLTEMAQKDKLTGLYNRNYLEYLLDYEFHRARQEKINFIVFMIDIDKFKFFNDHYSHNFGDKVLNLVAKKISENTRKCDITGRYGGDEFLIMLPKTTIAKAKEIAQKMLNSVLEINIESNPIQISLSIGIAEQVNEKNIFEVVEKADKAMYKAKQDGGNRFSLFIE